MPAEQEDYIKRQIDQMGQVLGKILAGFTGFKACGQVNQGIEAAGRALTAELGLNFDDLALIPAESFLTTLLETKKFSENNFEKLAELMFLVAEELKGGNTGGVQMKNLYGRALIIFEILDQTSSTYSYDRHSKIEKIRKVL